MSIPQFTIDKVIQTALEEDINYLDTTTDYLIPAGQFSDAYFLAKADGVLRFEKLGKDRKQACVYPAE